MWIGYFIINIDDYYYKSSIKYPPDLVYKAEHLHLLPGAFRDSIKNQIYLDYYWENQNSVEWNISWEWFIIISISILSFAIPFFLTQMTVWVIRGFQTQDK